jgi:hypothetical protein
MLSIKVEARTDMHRLLGLVLAAFLIGCTANASSPKELTIESNGATITVSLDPLVSFSDGAEKLIGAMAVASHPKHGTHLIRYNVLLSTCKTGEKLIFATLPTGHEILFESNGTDAPDSPAAKLHDAICKAVKTSKLLSVSGPGQPERGKDI